MYIYLIVNHVTGKYYIGQHKGNNLRNYFQRKFSDARHDKGSSHLFRSMRKHPLPCDWSIHALLSDVQTKPELDAYERDFIVFLHSQDPEYGYNICRGGEGFTGPHSESARLKVGEASRKRWANPDYKKTAIESMKKVGGECRAIGGRAGGRQAVVSGQLDSVRVAAREGLIDWRNEHPKEVLANCRKGGQTNVENGHMDRMRAKADLAAGGRTAGRMAVESGRLVPMRCVRWNINRGKPCVCGKHNEERTYQNL